MFCSVICSISNGVGLILPGSANSLVAIVHALAPFVVDISAKDTERVVTDHSVRENSLMEGSGGSWVKDTNKSSE